MPNITVSKLAELAGVHIETVRFYENEGLMPSPRRGVNGYRYYNESDVERLRFVQRAKTLGFTLAETAELLDMSAGIDATCEDVSGVARKKIDEVDARIRLLKEIRSALASVVKT